MWSTFLGGWTEALFVCDQGNHRIQAVSHRHSMEWSIGGRAAAVSIKRLTVCHRAAGFQCFWRPLAQCVANRLLDSEKDVWYWDGNGRISRYGHNHGHAITPRTAHCTCHKGLWCCVSEVVSSTSGEDPRRKRPGLGAVLSQFAYPEIFILQL